MSIDRYIMSFETPNKWFYDEVQKGHHMQRVSKVVSHKDYLSGRHKVLNREDAKYKTKELITRKTVINYAKTIINFHTTYLLGKPVNLIGDKEIVEKFSEIYKKGNYETIDYQILDRVNKFGDSFECLFFEDGVIKSKVLDNIDCYPVYDDSSNYIAFIEHWTDAFSNISYYNVYYDDRVEFWNNGGGDLILTDTKKNYLGLPIHYHNFNDDDYYFGSSMLNDITPLMDELEDILSKMGDAVYINSLNPLNVSIGQTIDTSIPADVTGYVLNLEAASDFKSISTMMDYNTIKLYLDNIKEHLNAIACIPSVLGNTNIANVSEVALAMLFHMANIKAMETQKWLNIGMNERFKRFKKVLKMLNNQVEGNISVEYNISIPTAQTEIIENLKLLNDMGAISTETLMKKSGYIKDVESEMERIKKVG